MTGLRRRSLGAFAAALVCAATVGVLPDRGTGAVAELETLITDVALLDSADTASGGGLGLIMGGTGNPTPDTAYFDAVRGGYLENQFPIPHGSYHALVTPEQFCPIVCVPAGGAPGGIPDWSLPAPLDPADYPPQLSFGSSVYTGAGILSNAIRDNIDVLQNGDPLAVFGYSQSAVISTVVMQDLIANAGADGYPTLDELANLHVVLIGNPNDPLTGLLTRFQFPDGIEAFNPLTSAMQHLPFLNVPLGIGPTPTDVIPTDIYTAAYDGWANFPADPTNLPAVLNAIIGILTEHGTYPDLAADSAVELTTIGETTFHMFPTAQLPLLWPIYQLGDVGEVLGAALQPGLALGINWGYGNPGDLAASQVIDHAGDALVGPWAVNASGELATGGGLAGFIPMMDPLQMLAGVQDAGVHTLLDPVNTILGFIDPDLAVPGWLDDGLHLSYDLTNALDQFLLSGWTDLLELLQDTVGDIGINGLDLVNLIGPDAVFTGLPLISGAPVIDAVGVIFDVFNFFGA
ncbi:PE-PPE domain-containing protein [Mycolicibacillus parakoreensis]|uniref:PE-PPE domain-containing protein n=1 Tax=Mycolicibacillus parakoreensis TaxID=1069221 RepID=A0ABY3TWC9_9MYCO|nr:PE-PPE domain-containing protein [Mycolicibacillus parakoreensis]MCV7315513.1 PE-PPE domain-containing protein [Mycolicibacillus parakoreensis]ULN52034.1 PE-PPE domain-containing protein [Mycolicibacillus parakoreensis]